MIVVLMGYMASGKSTIGRILALKLGYDFIDLDDFIEENEGKSVSDIFKNSGEIYFRRIESNYLNTLLSEKDHLVLSLGGGTPCYGTNMSIISNSPKTKSFYLKASIPSLVSRLKGEKAKRPLIANIETDDLLSEFIGKHLFERAQFYNLATHIITTDNRAEIDIVEELTTILL